MFIESERSFTAKMVTSLPDAPPAIWTAELLCVLFITYIAEYFFSNLSFLEIVTYSSLNFPLPHLLPAYLPIFFFFTILAANSSAYLLSLHFSSPLVDFPSFILRWSFMIGCDNWGPDSGHLVHFIHVILCLILYILSLLLNK